VADHDRFGVEPWRQLEQGSGGILCNGGDGDDPFDWPNASMNHVWPEPNFRCETAGALHSS
jgi:hypothetical protein